MAKKSVVRLDDSRFPNSDIYSVRSTVALENGFVGKLGAVEAANADIRALVAPAAGDGELVLIANPATIYDNARLGSAKEDQYEMEANEAVRAYGLRKTFIFAVSAEGFTTAPTVGQFVITAAGHKLAPSATAPTGGFSAKVLRKETKGGNLSANVAQAPTEYFVLEVVSN